MKTIAEGAKEVTKVTLGIDVCSREEAARRLAICSSCPKKQEVTIGNSSFWSCSECDCILQIKQFSNSKKCPLNKW